MRSSSSRHILVSNICCIVSSMRYGVLLIIASLATGTVSTFALLQASVWSSAHHRAESSLLRSGLFGEQTVLDRVNITTRPSVVRKGKTHVFMS
jgi:hypothetical protein